MQTGLQHCMAAVLKQTKQQISFRLLDKVAELNWSSPVEEKKRGNKKLLIRKHEMYEHSCLFFGEWEKERA